MAPRTVSFIVRGVAHSVNNKSSRSRKEWMVRVRHAAEAAWNRSGLERRPQDGHPVEVSITTFFTAVPRDVDNVIKPILDAIRMRQASEAGALSRPMRPAAITSLPFHLLDDDNMVTRVVSERVDLNLELTPSLVPVAADSNLLAVLDSGEQEFVHVRVSWTDEE